MQPCPDVLFSESLQVEASPLPSREPVPGLHWAMWGIVAVLVTAVIIDLILVKLHKPTMSDVPRKGPKWFKFIVGGALTALIWHLLIQGQ